MKFVLEIELGNAEMETRYNVGTALESVAAYLIEDDVESLELGASGTIRDDNGNTVGSWKVE